MKDWVAPEIEVLDISKTEWGIFKGGVDGHFLGFDISGSWKPGCGGKDDPGPLMDS